MATTNPETLQVIIDGAYSERNMLVRFLAAMYPSGICKTSILGWDPAWEWCVYIDTPEGQMPWHYHEREHELFNDLPLYDKDWDGHDTRTKYERLTRLTHWLKRRE